MQRWSRLIQDPVVVVIIACVLGAAMGVPLKMAHSYQPSLSASSASFIRVCLNLLLWLVMAAQAKNRAQRLEWRPTPALMWWGFFGALTVLGFYGAIQEIGLAQTAFLQATNGIFTVMLAPVLLKQRNTRTMWFAVALGFWGLSLILPIAAPTQDWHGYLLGVGSGFTAACAYMTLSRSERVYHPLAIMLYWSLGCLVVHGVLFLYRPPEFPSSWSQYGLIILSGILASLSQGFLTWAYQQDHASRVAALSYLTPVFCLALEWMFFQHLMAPRELAGAGIILAAGLGIVVTRQRETP